MGERVLDCAVLEDGTAVFTRKAFDVGVGKTAAFNPRRFAGSLALFAPKAAESLGNGTLDGLAKDGQVIPLLPATALTEYAGNVVALAGRGQLKKYHQDQFEPCLQLTLAFAHTGIEAAVYSACGFKMTEPQVQSPAF